ncbi:RelA/SpoT domain-containing protein [Desulfovibrio sp. OttesenSCG-928-G15]|nr:RelA/SpoT domain-containing protein [Desulfovibrio sp. OttesenSCG-928-G15]
MESVEPLAVPSRSAIRKAGDILRSREPSPKEYLEAISLLSHWRSLYSYPINTFQAYLRAKIKRNKYSSAIVAQRLKRMPSIVNKLQRFPSMQLDRMQDIGGLRVVLKNISEVFELHESILGSKRFEHTPEMPPRDYIKIPKDDGYRSLHQVFKYANKKHPELNGLRIELQIRTLLQHSWATAVETLGIVEKSSFKTGEGGEQFKRFFKVSSALFSMDEGTSVLAELKNESREQLIQELNEIENALQVSSKLKGLTISAKHIEQTSLHFAGYHLMELDIEKGRISLIPFLEKQLDSAEDLYRAREQATRDNPNISVVLISAGNVKDIKKAYPNYFLDTNGFLKNLNRICGKQ